MTSSRILSSHLPSSWASLYLLFVSRQLLLWVSRPLVLLLLLLLVSRLLLLLMPRFNSASFDLKQPNPILAHCIHLLHQSLKNIQMPICKHAKEDMSLETWSEANASISSFWSLLIRTPVVFANEGARAQWRGVAAPSSADLVHSHWSVFNVQVKVENAIQFCLERNLCMNQRRLFATRLPDILLLRPVCLKRLFVQSKLSEKIFLR